MLTAHLDNRTAGPDGAADKTIAITPRGPFSWTAVTDMLAGWPPVQRYWRGTRVLHMAFPLDGDFTPVAVALWDDQGMVRGLVSGTDRLDAVTAQVARMFSLDHDGSGYPAVGERDPHIGRLMAALPGFRPVCFSSPYEAAAWAIISQRISTRQAAQIQDRLIAEHGHHLWVDGVEAGCFPTPERLLGITAIPGLSAQKVERLHGVARAALDGLLDAEHLRALGDEAAPAALRAIPGIGPFWASGIYPTGVRDRRHFPQ